MTKLCLKVLLLASLLAVSGQIQANNVERFAKWATYNDAKISPGGDYLAIRMMREGAYILYVVDAKTKANVGATVFSDDTEVGEFFWVNDERIVIKTMTRNQGQEELFYSGELYAVNADGKRRELIYGYRAGENAAGSRLKKQQDVDGWADIIDLLAEDEDNILISSTPYSDSKGLTPSVYKLNVYNGKLRKIKSSPVPGAQFITNPEGELALVVGVEADGRTRVFSLDKKNEWQPVSKFQYGGNFQPLTMTADGKSLYTLDDAQADTTGLYKLDLASGKYENVYTEKGVDISSASLSVDGRSVTAVRIDPDYPTYVMLDKTSAEAALFKQLIAQFPGEAVSLTSHDEKGNVWVIHTESAYNPGTLYLYDKKKNKLALLFRMVKGLRPEQMTEVVPVAFKASDDTNINGYITYTATETQSALPMVVLVHGGPTARDYWSYNPEVQMLASLGYRVLQINYRGSTGYGRKFALAGDPALGRPGSAGHN